MQLQWRSLLNWTSSTHLCDLDGVVVGGTRRFLCYHGAEQGHPHRLYLLNRSMLTTAAQPPQKAEMFIREITRRKERGILSTWTICVMIKRLNDTSNRWWFGCCMSWSIPLPRLPITHLTLTEVIGSNIMKILFRHVQSLLVVYRVTSLCTPPSLCVLS